jgi:undecaprenyl-diphosphatase
MILAIGVAAGVAGIYAALPRVLRSAETVRLWLGRRSPRLARYADTLKGEWAFLCIMIGVILVAAFVFFSIAEDVVEGHPAYAADTAVYTLMRSLRTPAGDTWLISVTELGDSVVVTTMGAVVAAWLAYKRTWRALLFWILTIAGGSILNTAIKIALHRTRPTDLYHTGWDAFSFPSGHSTTNAVLYGFLAVLIGRELPKRLRLPLAYAACLLVALIAFSRLYLGAHWLSDVAGGLTFGSLWVGALALLYVHHTARPVSARALLAISVATLIVAGGFHIVRHHDADLKFYAVRSAS